MDALIRLFAAFALAARAAAGEGGAEILLVRPNAADFQEAARGFSEALGDSLEVRTVVVDAATRPETLAATWNSLHPRAVVLLDNRSIQLAREVRAKLGDTTTPLVGLMGVRTDPALRGEPHTVALRYEVPAVTALVNLRGLLERPVRRVGVLARVSWRGDLESEGALCGRENLVLSSVFVPDAGAGADDSLREALARLVRDPGLDALWIPNDNVLLSPRRIRDLWIPALRRWKRPVVVGVEVLADPALGMGDFAVLPDPYSLGVQAAGLVQEMADEDWDVPVSRVELPLSVLKVVAPDRLRLCCGLREATLGEIDRIRER